MRRSKIFGLEFDVAEREGGFELQSKETQVTCPRKCLFSGFLGSPEVFPGCHDVGIIKNHRDSNDDILALFRESNRFGNGCMRLVCSSLLKKGLDNIACAKISSSA